MADLSIPDTCGALLLPNSSLFPHSGMPLHIFEPRYIHMLERALQEERVFCVADIIESEEDPTLPNGAIGTAGLIRMARKNDDGTYHCLIQGLVRVEFTEWLETESIDFPLATIEPLPDIRITEEEAEDIIEKLRQAAAPAVENLPELVRLSINSMLENIDDLGVLADLLTQQLVKDASYRHELMSQSDVKHRIDILVEYLELGIA